MKARFRIVALLVLLAIAGCAKKEAEEGMAIPVEESSAHVDIPPVHWKVALAFHPVRVMTGDEKSLAVAAVLQENLASRLSRVPTLKVLMHDAEYGAPEYALDIGLDSFPDGMAVSMALESASGNPILSQVFEKEPEAVFSVSGEAASMIASALKTALPEEARKIPEWGMPSIRSYLSARALLERDDRESVNQSVQAFKALIRSDSTYTPAYLGLADAYLSIARERWDANPVWLSLSQDACLKALSLDPRLEGAHLRLGRTYLQWGDFKKAEHSFRHALLLNPNLPEAWTGLARVFSQYGLYTPSLEVFDRIQALGPPEPDLLLSRAMILIGMKRYKEAEQSLLSAESHFSGRPDLAAALALSLYYQGQLEKAQRTLRAGHEDALTHAVLAMILIRQNKTEEAYAELELYVKPNAGSNSGLASAVSALYSLLGQNGQALEWLEKAVAWGYREYPWLINDPNFSGLRNDARSESILARLKAEWEERSRQYSGGSLSNSVQ